MVSANAGEKKKKLWEKLNGKIIILIVHNVLHEETEQLCLDCTEIRGEKMMSNTDDFQCFLFQ